MASNISVAITVDNKQYIAGVKAADAATQTFSRDVDKSLSKAGGSFDVFSKKILGLKTLIAGISFGALGRGALQFADELQDLSVATGLTVSNLLSLQQALAVSGGDAQSMSTGITQFARSIDEAAQGSLKAQNTFAELGINLNDLKTLSEQDLFTATIAGFDKIGNKSREAAIKIDLFGKSFKTVSPKDLADELERLGNKNDKYAASLKTAADLNDRMNASITNLRIAFLQATAPIVDLINRISDSGQNVERLTAILKVFGVVLLAVFGGGLFRIATTVIGSLIRGVQALLPVLARFSGSFGKVAIESSKVAKFMATSFAGQGPVMNALRTVLTTIGAIGAALAGIFLLSSGAPKGGANAESNKEDAETTREVTDALAKRRQEIQQNISAFKKQSAEILDNINIENILIGKSEDFAEILRAQEAVFKRSADKIEELRQAKAALSKDEAGLASAYDEQIKKIQAAASADAARITKALENQQGLKLIEKDRLQQLENMTKAMEAQAKIQEALSGARLAIISQGQDTAFAGSQIGLGDLQKQLMNIAEANRKAGAEAGRAFAAAFEDGGDGLTSTQAQQLALGLDAIAQGYKDITAAQTANLELSRTFGVGWSEAFQTYRDAAQNAAEQSKTYFDTFTKGFEDAFVKMVQTGKLSFKDLANSLIADFARIQAKKALLGIFDMGGANSQGSGFSFGTLFGSIGKIFGFANGGNPPVNRPSIVGERGPELFVPRSAGTIVPAGQFGQGGNMTAVTYNINAVDASSFRSLIARDPEFIHNVSEQGRRSLPIRSRR
jgi:lambda family phage tail tape measure protein